MKKLILTIAMLLLVASGVQAATSQAYDTTVAASASVDTEIGAGVSTIWVKSGSVTETITVDIDNTRIYFEPGFALTGGINITGNNCSLVFGAGCSVSDEIDVTTGVEAYIKCENGCSLEVLDINTARAYINGGGWGTVCDGAAAGHAIEMTGGETICENISAQTTGDGGNTVRGIQSTTNGKNIVSKCKVIDSDASGILTLSTTAPDCIFIGNTVLESDTNCIFMASVRGIIIGNYTTNDSGTSDLIQLLVDDGLAFGNVSQKTGGSGSPIEAASGADDCIVVGNRTDGVVNDAGTSSTVSLNDGTAF